MKILAIDPGNEESAWVVYDVETGKLHQTHPLIPAHAKEPNAEVLMLVNNLTGGGFGRGQVDVVVIEQIACMGMAVGAEVFETVFWSGRFAQEAYMPFDRVKRHQVKMHLCGNMRAKDANIRQAIIDRFGGKKRAIGKKASPGPLYGVSGDCWAALAVAITFAETAIELEARP